MKSLVKVALQFSYSFSENIPAGVGFICLPHEFFQFFDFDDDFLGDEVYWREPFGKAPSDFPKCCHHFLIAVLLIAACHYNIFYCSIGNSEIFEVLVMLQHFLVFCLHFSVLFPGENGIQILSRNCGCIMEHFVVSFNLREVHLLLKDEFVEFGVQVTVRTLHQVVQVLAYLAVQSLLRTLVLGESVEQVEDRNDVPPVPLSHVLH